MGVYFKCMKMPTNCDLCPLHERYTTEVACKITGSRFKVSGIPFASYQMEDCPAQEIQVPHGKLVDADTIPYKKIMYDEETDEFYYGVTKPYIDRMPTIIEAEE